MEYSDKYVLVPISEEFKYKNSEDLKKFLIKILKLAKCNAYNDKLEININGKFITSTNIIDYILEKDNLKYEKEYLDIINKCYKSKDDLYTTISPIKKKQNWIYGN